MLALLVLFLAGLWFDGGGMAQWRADVAAPLRFSTWRVVLDKADNILLLAWASGVGLAVAVGLALAVARVPWTAVVRAVLLGVRSSLLPVTVLVLAWALSGACNELGTGEFLAGLLKGTVPAALFPALVFTVAGVTSFSTGTSWGTMAILIPIAVPAAHGMDGDAYGLITVLSIAAVLDGAIFGDHCSPISDTTIMSSTASSCDHLAHVRTQMPYSLTVAGIVLCIGYVPAAAGAPKWVGMAGATAVMGLLFGWLAIRRRS
jgi:Na+/H+ antiporter NhaC